MPLGLKAMGQHPLIEVLRKNKGNPRTLILMEPLWGIPQNLIAPFATLYMYIQGITDIQIGLMLSIGMAAQVFFSFIGGVATDKLGRKYTTMMGDFFGWSVACFIWGFSGNFWLFLAAVLFNGFEQINQTAWFCLLIEDADPKSLVGIYTWANIGGLVAVFFAPVSGLLIGAFSVVPVIRVIYFIFSFNMFLKVLITLRYCSETRQGKIRMAETKNTSVAKMLLEYRELIPRVFRDKEVMKALALSVIVYITNMISVNFFGLYITQRLGIPERYLAFFPILNAALMLIFMFGIQHRIDAVKFRIPLWAGLTLYAGAALLLILTPAGGLPLIVVYVFMAAVANALVGPRREALLQLTINPHERARINALLVSFTIAFSSPFGYFIGLLSSIDRRLPFCFALALFVTAIVIVGRIKDPEFAE